MMFGIENYIFMVLLLILFSLILIIWYVKTEAKEINMIPEPLDYIKAIAIYGFIMVIMGIELLNPYPNGVVIP